MGHQGRNLYRTYTELKNRFTLCDDINAFIVRWLAHFYAIKTGPGRKGDLGEIEIRCVERALESLRVGVAAGGDDGDGLAAQLFAADQH